ncbi:selenocysteine-specific elongation factor [Diaphorina citri]|uniref:Selenocysteine-specific elongation factor n=1 Tax=Diaphorina citri TaxID=121845 RepID=A0A3Q0JHD9_DIACI|nr:selenocysteine-specific elongation factor [Diaphorina citri]
MLMAVDHCFSIRGQGTIFTGSMLEGCVRVNDVIEIPALQITRKVKSIQIFRKSVDLAIKGDRVGLCVTQVDCKLFERGLVTSENYLKSTYACVTDLNFIKYYKHSIKSKGKTTLCHSMPNTCWLIFKENRVNDVIEIPALQITRKVKSIQIFRKSVDLAIKGDRVGLCVTQVDCKLFERGLVTSENYLKSTYACVTDLNFIKYYKHSIKSKGKYHCSIGHDTVLAKITIFQSEQNDHSQKFIDNGKVLHGTYQDPLEASLEGMKVTNMGDEAVPEDRDLGETGPKIGNKNISDGKIENKTTPDGKVENKSMSEGEVENNLPRDKDNGSGDKVALTFDPNEHYLYVDEISRDTPTAGYFALLEFEKPILAPPSSLIIGSKLDTVVHSTSCRLAFHGRMRHNFTEKNYDLTALNVYKRKTKCGQIDRVVNPTEIICKNLFGKNQLNYVDVFVNFKVRLSTGETGVVEGTFGKSGKVKIRLEDEVKGDCRATVELRLRKYLFHKKKIRQD